MAKILWTSGLTFAGPPKKDILQKKETRLQEIRTELSALRNATVNEADLRKALDLSVTHLAGRDHLHIVELKTAVFTRP